MSSDFDTAENTQAAVLDSILADPDAVSTLLLYVYPQTNLITHLQKTPGTFVHSLWQRHIARPFGKPLPPRVTRREVVAPVQDFSFSVCV